MLVAGCKQSNSLGSMYKYIEYLQQFFIQMYSATALQMQSIEVHTYRLLEDTLSVLFLDISVHLSLYEWSNVRKF